MDKLVFMNILALISDMRKNFLEYAKCVAILLIVSGFFASCKSEELENQQEYCCEYMDVDVETPCITSDCWDEQCYYYRQIWKELFLEETGFTEDYFSKHVFLCGLGTSVSSIPGSTYWMNINVRYQIRVGWAIVESWDSFVIQHEEGPFLTKEDIKRDRTPKKYREVLANHNVLKFTSLKSAMSYLKKQTQVNNLCVSSLYFDPNTGDVILRARNSSVNFTRSCDNLSISAYLNLITGETRKDEAYLCID